MIPIVAQHVVPGKKPSVDFNSGAAAIGTGPFLYKEFSPGNRIVVARIPNWWGGDPVGMKWCFGPRRGQRPTGRLLNGDVDLIDYPPTVDLPQLEADKRFRVSSIASDQLIYMMPSYRHREPYITANDGSSIPNPMRDWRVRKALSLAINREAIRDRIMGGASQPTRNNRATSFFGYVDDLKPMPMILTRQRLCWPKPGMATVSA